MLVKLIDRLFPPKEIYAHCDIPCGIYDPHNAQMAAHTVIRMNNLIQELPKEDTVEREHKLARLTKIKEDHAELLKHEVRVIWGDFFKAEHLEKFPDLHALVFEIMKLASKARQEINLDAANSLLEKTQEFAEIFFKAKGAEPIRMKSLYPTEGEIVTHK